MRPTFCSTPLSTPCWLLSSLSGSGAVLFGDHLGAADPCTFSAETAHIDRATRPKSSFSGTADAESTLDRSAAGRRRSEIFGPSGLVYVYDAQRLRHLNRTLGVALFEASPEVTRSLLNPPWPSITLMVLTKPSPLPLHGRS